LHEKYAGYVVGLEAKFVDVIFPLPVGLTVTVSVGMPPQALAVSGIIDTVPVRSIRTP
jgi:hypothetical protein